jgi:cytochrome c-type biogenesis protein CcmH
MIAFVVAAALMLAAACAWVLIPLLSRRHAATLDRDASNLSVLRDQRAELDADLATGVLSPDQHEAARDELERRVLDEVAQPHAVAATHRASALTVAFVGAGMPIAAVLLYLVLGTPAALVSEEHPAAATRDGFSPQQIESMIARVKERLAAKPDDLEGWSVLARTYRALGRESEAVFAFERAVALAPNDADLLADYADAIAVTQNRSLEGKPEEIIARALRANPAQWKANALAGTIHFQRGDHAKAIAYWERAKTAVPPDSPVAQAIEASLAEARQKSVPIVGPKVAGTVALSSALSSDVAPDDTVFVYARPADGSRMPLALVRGKAKDLPLAFTLDDSTAMLPTRRISEHAEVIVGARVSKTGDATPKAGDLEAAPAPVKLGATGVTLLIDRKVP